MIVHGLMIHLVMQMIGHVMVHLRLIHELLIVLVVMFSHQSCLFFLVKLLEVKVLLREIRWQFVESNSISVSPFV